MDNETVYNKLRKMESFLDLIPTSSRIMYQVKVVHLASDFVGLSFSLGEYNYLAISADRGLDVFVDDLSDGGHIIHIKAHNIDITLYGNNIQPMSHITIV